MLNEVAEGIEDCYTHQTDKQKNKVESTSLNIIHSMGWLNVFNSQLEAGSPGRNYRVHRCSSYSLNVFLLNLRARSELSLLCWAVVVMWCCLLNFTYWKGVSNFCSECLIKSVEQSLLWLLAVYSDHYFWFCCLVSYIWPNHGILNLDVFESKGEGLEGVKISLELCFARLMFVSFRHLSPVKSQLIP